MTREEVSWVTGPGSTEFFVNVYNAEGSPQAVLLFLHGFIEHIRRYAKLFPLWSAKGITVVCFDQRGFGETSLNKAHNKKARDSYGKTSSKDQQTDVAFFVDWCKSQPQWNAVPLFLMGHSMGGAVALGFATRLHTPTSKDTLAKISGVIATSPLLLQTHAAPKWQRVGGSLLSALLPWLKIPTPVKPEHLSHDDAVNAAYSSDPLVIMQGTLKGVSEMLNFGEEILRNDFGNWQFELPLLLLHGSDDQVTSHAASEQFVKKLAAKDKVFTSYSGGFHELHNEPDGVGTKVIEECTSWIKARAADSPLKPLGTASAKL